MRHPYLEESIRLHDWLSFPARAYAIADQEALVVARQEHAQMVAALQAGERDVRHDLALRHMGRARQIYAERYLLR